MTRSFHDVQCKNQIQRFNLVQNLDCWTGPTYRINSKLYVLSLKQLQVRMGLQSSTAALREDCRGSCWASGGSLSLNCPSAGIGLGSVWYWFGIGLLLGCYCIGIALGLLWDCGFCSRGPERRREMNESLSNVSPCIVFTVGATPLCLI